MTKRVLFRFKRGNSFNPADFFCSLIPSANTFLEYSSIPYDDDDDDDDDDGDFLPLSLRL